MNIEKYYWKAKDENEARVIIALLCIDHKPADLNNLTSLIRGAIRTNIGVSLGEGFNIFHNLANVNPRTLSTIPALVEMALRGFKDAWEVAEDGFKLVTIAERENNEYPTDCEVRWMNTAEEWTESVNSCVWKLNNYQDWMTHPFAVPTSYEFKKPWEVAPEGYRLVTEEERVNNNKPSCAKIIHNDAGISWWEVDLCSPWIDTCNYAVPTSYEFKKPWEVAPEGYRLVTEEEREEFKYEDGFMMIETGDNGLLSKWIEVNVLNPAIKMCEIKDMTFAVPTSYEFETSNQKQIRELADSIRRDTTKLEELKKGE